jgi:hypothetical protein
MGVWVDELNTGLKIASTTKNLEDHSKLFNTIEFPTIEFPTSGKISLRGEWAHTEQIQEKIMLDFTKTEETFTRVFGEEITNKTDNQLMSMVREAKKEIEGLSDLSDLSSKVRKTIEGIQAGINTLTSKLDGEDSNE